MTFSEQDDIFISEKEEKDLSFYFTNSSRRLDLENSTNVIVKKDYPYVDSSHQKETCQIYEDYDLYVIILALVVPVFYIIIALIVICYCIKLRRISSQYEMLVEEKDSNVLTNAHEPSRKIEMSYDVHTAS